MYRRDQHVLVFYLRFNKTRIDKLHQLYVRFFFVTLTSNKQVRQHITPNFYLIEIPKKHDAVKIYYAVTAPNKN